jgi:hypothetical protein
MAHEPVPSAAAQPRVADKEEIMPKQGMLVSSRVPIGQAFMAPVRFLVARAFAVIQAANNVLLCLLRRKVRSWGKRKHAAIQHEWARRKL